VPDSPLRRALLFCGIGLTALVACPALAGAFSPVTLQASLQPERLGSSTNLSIGFRIATKGGQEPTPLSSFAVTLPTGMGFAETTLGLATCSERALLEQGVGACPRESLMGSGYALVQAPFGSELVTEKTPASIFMTEPVEGHTTMLFYFTGRSPVIAALALQTQVLTGVGSSDSVLSTAIPGIPTAPGAPDVSMLALDAIIGPGKIIYYKRIHGRRVAYHPKGLGIPARCPRGGFLFTGEFGFQDGSRANARSVVPCPGGGGGA
jgi:hypothetical protein